MADFSLAGRALADSRLAARAGAALAPAGAFLAVAGLAAADGGYYPTSWGWITLAFAWAAGVALLVRERIVLTRLELAFAAGFAALLGWTALSLFWTDSIPRTASELERTLMYATAVVALLAVVRRRSLRAFAGAVTAAVTAACLYGLLTRLFPDRFPAPAEIAGYRLAEPLGYWNGLGIFAAMGVLLALGFAARSRSLTGRAFAAAALVPLTLTLYFTFSRGGWIALAVGLAAIVVLDPLRLQLTLTLAAMAPAPAIAVAFASRSEALTRFDATLDEASSDGRELALATVLLAAAAALAGAGLGRAERSYRPPPQLRRAYAVGLIAVLVLALGTITVRYGSPPTVVRDVWSAFKAPPPSTEGDLNRRLFNLSGSGRYLQWKAAVNAGKERPLAGSGAGTFEQHWLEQRPVAGKVRDAHSLYLEMFAELGIVGLGLLAATLALPLVAGVQGRRRPLVPIAFGTYAAYLAHAGVDWDWELPAVTITALCCAVFLLASGHGDATEPAGQRLRDAAVAACVAAAAIAVVVTLGNNAIAEAGDAIRSGDWAEAERDAASVRRWAPWSEEGWRRAGQADVGRGRYRRAEARLRAAIGKDPRNWELWFDLALATLGKTQREALERAERLNPLSPELAEFRAEVIAPRSR
jgi:hypothetical protein